MPQFGSTLAPATPYTPIPYDMSKLMSYAQQASSAPLRKARRGLQGALLQAQGQENPAIAAMMLREALSGHGGAIGEAMAAGQKTGAEIYGQEYQGASEAAKASWLENVTRERSQWQSDVETAYNQYALNRQLASQEDIARKSRKRQDIGYGVQGAGILSQLLAAYMAEKGAHKRALYGRGYSPEVAPTGMTPPPRSRGVDTLFKWLGPNWGNRSMDYNPNKDYSLNYRPLRANDDYLGASY